MTALTRMGLGLGLGLGGRPPGAGGGGGAFTPANLFASSEPGFWTEISPSMLWQDSARTTAAVVDQPVGSLQLNTASGTLYAAQSTTAFKPVLRQSGALYWLEFDGVDDYLSVAATFAGVQQLSLFAAARKSADSFGTVVELGSNSFTEDNSFGLLHSVGGFANWRFAARGTAAQATTASPIPAPDTSVFTGLADMVADTCSLRRNGALAATSNGDFGTGGIASKTLYIGRRNGAANPFTGNLYGLIVRCANSTTQEIADTEAWLAARSGVTL